MQSSVIPIIELWEEFLSKNEKAGVGEFALWILQKEAINNEDPGIKNRETAEEVLDDSAKAMLLISRIQRLIQMKAKPIIKKMGFKKDHEYSMITHLYLLKTPNKKELAQNMLLENSTAVEITNRLLKKGLIKEVADESDKRSTRISLTAAGEKMLFDSYIYMKDLPDTFLSCLNPAEKKELVSLLQKIEKYQLYL